MSEWFHHLDDSLWLEPDDSGEQEALFIRKALRLKRGRRVLDAPCGAGRIAVHLVRAGCIVTGVDLNPRFIERARRRFATEGVSGQFAVSDLRQLDYQQEFDAICNWDGSFGYFSDAENADVLRRFAAALKPGGRLVVEQINRQFLMSQSDVVLDLRPGTRLDRWNASTQRMDSVWTIEREDGEVTCHSSTQLYTPAEFRELLERVGLRWERAYGMGRGHRPPSRRLIVVGRKC